MGLGDFVTGIFGSKNKTKVSAPKVDPNAYQYGGHPGGADEAANRYRQQAEGAQQRQGEQVNYSQANADRARALQARAGQNTLASAMQARALGQTPSIAQMQADRQMQQVAASQASASASSRGPAAMALAQQGAANNTANAQSDISGQAQINAANERMQAEQAASGAYANMRSGDQQSQGQAAQQSQYQSGMNAQQRAQNDQYSLGMTSQEQGVRNSQLTAGMNQQAQQSANALGAGSINAGVAGQNASMNQTNGMGLVGMGSSIAGGAMGALGGGSGTPPPKAKGGPVSGNHPYLVGEEGPELVIPKKDGVVIPAGPTAALLGGSVPRATGGPIQAGGVPPSMIAPSTWGSGGPDVAGQQAAMQDALASTVVGNQSRALADGTESPWERDVRRTNALQRSNPELVTDADRASARRSKGVLRSAGDEPAEEKKKPEAKADALPAQKFSVGKMVAELGQQASKQAAAVDTGYHGGGGGGGNPYAPHLLAIGGARAMGGPIQAGGAPGVGGAVDIGSGGSGISSAMVKQASSGLGGGGMPGMVGGGGVVGGTNVPGGAGGMGGAMSGIGANAAHLASMVDTGYHPFGGFREQGGPVNADSSYIAGESGPEMVYPLYEPPGKQLHQDEAGHAFYATDPTEDDGRASLVSRGEQKAAPPPPPMIAPKAKAAPKQREMTPEELSAWADQQMQGMSATHEARMAQGPSVGAMLAARGRR